MTTPNSTEKNQVAMLAEEPRIKSHNLESLWLRIGNCEKPGRFQVILEGKDGAETIDHVIYDSIDEHDGNISHHHNLTWLLKATPESPQESPYSQESIEIYAREMNARRLTVNSEKISSSYKDVGAEFPEKEAIRQAENLFADQEGTVASARVDDFVIAATWAWNKRGEVDQDMIDDYLLLLHGKNGYWEQIDRIKELTQQAEKDRAILALRDDYIRQLENNVERLEAVSLERQEENARLKEQVADLTWLKSSFHESANEFKERSDRYKKALEHLKRALQFTKTPELYEYADKALKGES